MSQALRVHPMDQTSFDKRKGLTYDPQGCGKCLKLLGTILAFTWNGGMLRMCSLFPHVRVVTFPD